MDQNPGGRFFIVAGETSGDSHGAALMKAIKTLAPETKFEGIGGSRMAAAGLHLIHHSGNIAFVGFFEVLGHLPFMMRLLSRTYRHIVRTRPDRVILIDYPGFNLRLARRLRESGIPITYYISPQLWAWHEGRIATIRTCIDQMLVIFPFEVEWYRQRGVTATFVGHPLLEEPPPAVAREEFLQSLGLDPARKVLALFPGSRSQEIARHLPLFLEVARLITISHPQVQVVLGLARDLSADDLPADIPHGITVITEHPRLGLRYADTALVASGTATVEGAIWATPMVVVYRMAPLSWRLSRRLVKVPHAAMVNLLAGEGFVPEFLQNRAQAGPVARAIARYFEDEVYLKSMLKKLDAVKRSLKPSVNGSAESAGTASIRAATVIVRATS